MVDTLNLLRFIANFSPARFIIPKLMMEVSSAKKALSIAIFILAFVERVGENHLITQFESRFITRRCLNSSKF
ncbi:hypothetical protein [Nostoc sp.]|uniref:hypothetical protein n=1 Tax=Nostoc sp. TaxID=1180 RepID=UPI002FFAAD4D